MPGDPMGSSRALGLARRLRAVYRRRQLGGEGKSPSLTTCPLPVVSLSLTVSCPVTLIMIRMSPSGSLEGD